MGLFEHDFNDRFVGELIDLLNHILGVGIDSVDLMVFFVVSGDLFRACEKKNSAFGLKVGRKHRLEADVFESCQSFWSEDGVNFLRLVEGDCEAVPCFNYDGGVYILVSQLLK